MTPDAFTLGSRYSASENCTRMVVLFPGERWPSLIVREGKVEVLAWGAGP